MKPRCGIEVSSDAVKYVVLQGSRLVGYGRVPVTEAGGIGAALRGLREEGKLPTSRLRVALGTQTSILRMVWLPPMPAGDLARVVRGEVEKELQIFTEEMAFGYLALPRTPTARRRTGRPSSPEMRPGLIALTARGGLRLLEDQLSAEGLQVDLLTTTSLALLGHVCSLRDLARTEEAVAVLHVASDRMVLAVAQGGRFRQLRDLAVGMDASLLSQREATGTDDAQVDWDALDQIGRGLDEVTQVARQIRRTLEADAPAQANQQIQRLLLTGDVTRGEAMAPLLQNEVGLPVEVLDPLAGMKLREVEPFFAREAASYALPLALARATPGAAMLHLGTPAAPPIPVAWWGVALGLALASLAVGNITAPARERVRMLSMQPGLPETVTAGEDAAAWSRACGLGPRAPLEWLGRNLPAGAQATQMEFVRRGDDWQVRFDGTLRQPSVSGRLAAWSALSDALARTPRAGDVSLVPLSGEQPALREGVPVSATFRYRVRP